MGKKVEMIGKTFGRWTVLEEAKERQKNGSIIYLVECSCGNRKYVNGQAIRSGESTSCGCYNKEIISKPDGGYCKEALHNVWNAMKQRCVNKKDKAYHNYGGRGIRFCGDWNDYANFRSWAMKHGYEKGLWLDRVNNDGDYCPENCRFVSPSEQQNNKRTNKLLSIGGETKTMAQWSHKTGIGVFTIARRLELGWIPDLLLAPVDKKRSHGQLIKQAMSRGSRVEYDKENPRVEVDIQEVE